MFLSLTRVTLSILQTRSALRNRSEPNRLSGTHIAKRIERRKYHSVTKTQVPNHLLASQAPHPNPIAKPLTETEVPCGHQKEGANSFLQVFSHPMEENFLGTQSHHKLPGIKREQHCHQHTSDFHSTQAPNHLSGVMGTPIAKSPSGG